MENSGSKAAMNGLVLHPFLLLKDGKKCTDFFKRMKELFALIKDSLIK